MNRFALNALLPRLLALLLFCAGMATTAAAQYQTANSAIYTIFNSQGIYSNPGNVLVGDLGARLNGDGTVTLGGCIGSNGGGIPNAQYSISVTIINSVNGQTVGSTSLFSKPLPGLSTPIPFTTSVFTPGSPVTNGALLDLVYSISLTDGNVFNIDTRGRASGDVVAAPNPRAPGSWQYQTFRYGPGGYPSNCGLSSLAPCPTTAGSSFSASPTSILQGQSSTLSWNVPDATGVTIAGVGTFGSSGSVAVSPASTMTYTLTAAGPSTDCAPVTLQATVNVTQCPTVTGSSFAAAPSSIVAGQNSTLSWNVPNATSVTITGVGTFGPSGSIAVSPASTTTYTLTGDGAASCTPITLQTTVTVCPSVAASTFSAAPTTIALGGNSTLSWSVPGADSVTIAGVGTFTASGSVSVSPSSSTTYTLTSSGAGSCAAIQLQTTVNVTPCPTVAGSSFTASPTSIVLGASSTLTWSVPAATSVTISGVAGTFGSSGSVSVSPTSTTTYTLTSTGAGACASIQLQVTVAVTPCPTIAGSSFSAAPSSIVPGGSSTLSWNVPDATSVTISGIAGTFGASGSVSVSPSATTTYTLTATGAGTCAAIQLQATVNVMPCPTVAGSTFAASPSSIAPGDSSTLSWNVPAATSVTISGVPGTFGSSGSVAVSPASTTTYTLTATGAGTCSSITMQATVSVASCPTVAGSTFSASPSSIAPGGSSTLTWNVPNASSVTISGVAGTFGASGSVAVSPSATTTYTLTAAGPGTCAAIQLQATVTVAACPTVAGSSFTASPTTIIPGGSSTLTWNVPAATSVTISGVAGTFGSSGSVTVSPAGTTTYTLTAAGPGTCASIQLQATVTVTACQTIVSLSASATTINQGQSTTLSYTLTGATSATITDLTSGAVTGVPVQSGSLMVTPATTRTYRLAAVGPCATVTQDITITVNPAVVINSFAASVSPICSGQSTTLSWSATNGTSATISAPGLPGSPVVVNPVSGTLNVSPTTTTTYTLTVNGAGSQSVTSQTTVTVNQPPTINTFTATSTNINAGQSTTLSWTTTNAAYTVLTDLATGNNIAVFAPNDSYTVTPATTRTYRLTAADAAGCGLPTREITITVTACQTITSFTAAPTAIATGGTSTLSWATVGASSVDIIDLTNATVIATGQPANGSLSVTPAATTTYRLRATGPCAPQTQDVTVTVCPAASASTFTAAPATINVGQSSTLSWNVPNASTVTISGVAGTFGASGSTTVSPTNTTTYTLTAQGDSGCSPVTLQATVNVIACPAVAGSTFSAAPSSVGPGQSSMLSWNVPNATSVTISGVAGTFAASGSVSVSPSATTTYTLTAAGGAGCAAIQLQATVTVTPCQIINALTVNGFTSDTNAAEGSTVTVGWDISNYTTASITVYVNGVNSGSFPLPTPTGSRTFTQPSGSLAFVMVVDGSCQQIQLQRNVYTVPCPTAASSTFTASPSPISAGQSSTLSWNVPNAVTVTISGIAGTFGSTGSVSVSPASTTTYTLTAAGVSGCAPVTLQATVIVCAVKINSFTATPATVAAGGTSTLAWDISNTNQVLINTTNGTGSYFNLPASGTLTVNPAQTTTYQLVALSDNGTCSDAALTTVTVASGAVLIGPQGHPDAVGPTSNNDDYTNMTLTVGVAGPAGAVTTAGGVLTFINTIRNDASAADNVVLTAPVVPVGFTVEALVGLDDTTGAPVFVPLGGPGQSASFNIPAATQQDITLRITAPVGINVLAGYSTVLRATSSLSPQVHNDTIDRVWSGFVSAVKSQTVTNTTGVGGPLDAVSGATIEYALTYSNVTTASGTGNVNLTATNVVLTEDGNAPPNNWASTTNHVPGSASDTRGGAITGDVAGSTLLTDTVPSLAPAQSGVFKFRRVIN